MIYVLGLFFALTVIFIIRNKQRGSSLFLLTMLLSLIVVSLCFAFYMAKDNSYYYLIQHYFNISADAWVDLMLFPIGKDIIIRVLNISSLLFIYSGLCFPIAFTSMIGQKKKNKLMLILAIVPLLEIILFDPGIHTALYYRLYPDYLTVAAFKSIQEGIHIASKIINMAYLFGGVAILVLTYIRSAHIRYIKTYTLLILLSHFFLVVYYSVVLWWVPSYLITVSKIASYKAYLSMPLYRAAALYNTFPYFALVTLGLIAFTVYRYSLMQKKMQSRKLEIAKKIDTANITSSVFCHYMKNELRAMVAEIELLEQEPDTGARLAATIKDRCNDIYRRLDAIHRGTKINALNLKPVAVPAPIREIVAKIGEGNRPAVIHWTEPRITPYALIDEAYFKMVIENLIENAIDARKKGAEAVHITIRVETHTPWIMLSVSDDGVGIPPDRLDKVFNPFYSSKPTATNWGMGLSLCHKIVTAHDGKIEVESEEGAGATFKILLPLIFTA